MKIHPRTLFIVMVIGLLTWGQKATAQSFTYTVENNKTTITGFSIEPSGSVVIPATLGGYPVTEIDRAAFKDRTGITAISFASGESVTQIGASAFQGCSGLASVSFPSGTALLPTGVLSSCPALTTVIIPSSVTEIGDSAFAGCTNLTSLTLPSSLTRLGHSAFLNCRSLTSLTIPSGVTDLPSQLFEECRSLTSISLPAGIINIGASAFYNCLSLSSFILPDSVVTVGTQAFQGCSGMTSFAINAVLVNLGSDIWLGCDALTVVTVDASNLNLSSLEGVLFNKDQTELIFCPPGKSSPYAIPSTVTALADEAFAHCASLTSITIPSSLTYISSGAFYYASGLTSLNLPSTITSIEAWAFAGCDALTEVSLPANLTTLGMGSFYHASSLISLLFNGNAPSISTEVFDETATGFTLYYYSSATGFTSPTWEGYPCVLVGAVLTAGVSGEIYSTTLTADSGIAPYTWTLISGSLPAGLSLSESGVISGIPSSSGSYTFTVQITDSTSSVSTQTYTLTVAAPPLNISTASSLADGMVNRVYTLTLSATGGTSPYVWTLNSGSLPDGINLTSDGVITGTPTTAGSSTFSVKLTDNNSETLTQSMTLLILPSLNITTATILPGGVVDDAYALILGAAGGDSASYVWSLTESSLPEGLLFSSAGEISGTALVAGVYTFKVRVLDAASFAATQEFTLTIAATHLSITSTSPLVEAVATSPYSLTMSATGGTPDYTWSVSSGSLPPGLTLSASGILSGTPSLTGDYIFAVTVVDEGQLQTSETFSLTVSDPSIIITTSASLPIATKDTNYDLTMQAQGGVEPYTWEVLPESNLPTGLILSESGLLSGIPSVIGDYIFTIQVTDLSESVVTKTFSLSVQSRDEVPVIDSFTWDPVTIGSSFSHVVTARNFPQSFIIKGLPTGLKYGSTTGLISGHPAKTGVFPLEIKAKNKAGTSQPFTIALTVNALPSSYIGNFTGLISRDDDTNDGLGSRLFLSTTSKGSYSLKITTGSASLSTKGYLEESEPQITTTLGGYDLILTFDEDTQSISGTYGDAEVVGWRHVWNTKNNPPSRLTGYYSVGLTLAEDSGDGLENIPQGTGYSAITVPTSGIATIAGKTSDGQTISSSGYLGPDGQIAVYTSQYSKKGSICGILTLSELNDGSITDNSISGTLSWFKPLNTARAYAAGFGPLSLTVYGQYLRPVKRGIILGLPSEGVASLTFTDGGLDLAAVDPDVSAFTFTAKNTVTMPTLGGNENPAKTSLKINAKTGIVSGGFTLIDETLKRTVKYYGMIIRPESGTQKARGYFLLPQIPPDTETVRTSPILSGGVKIDQ